MHARTHAHTPRWAGTRKVKPIWISLKQETVSGSGISWAICKSAPCSRQTTTPAPYHSVFYRPDALPAAQPTVSKRWRLKGPNAPGPNQAKSPTDLDPPTDPWVKRTETSYTMVRCCYYRYMCIIKIIKELALSLWGKTASCYEVHVHCVHTSRRQHIHIDIHCAEQFHCISDMCYHDLSFNQCHILFLKQQ